jgi:hypothetical protein
LISQILGLVGLAGTILLLRKHRSMWRLSLVCALVAAAVGEVVVMLALRSPGERLIWHGMLAYYPLAVWSIGGWAALLGGFAGLLIRAWHLRARIPALLLVILGVVAGAVAGVVFSSVLLLDRATSGWNSAGFLFSERGLLLAGMCGGAACGALCALWPLPGHAV